MSEGRWDRLAADLQAAGFDVRVDERPYDEIAYGRPRYGITRSITFRAPGGLVAVHDAWWRKNPDVWTGWRVWAENREGIVLGRPARPSKKRSETVAAFQAALAQLERQDRPGSAGRRGEA